MGKKKTHLLRKLLGVLEAMLHATHNALHVNLSPKPNTKVIDLGVFTNNNTIEVPHDLAPRTLISLVLYLCKEDKERIKFP